jgi:hypothetical protein
VKMGAEGTGSRSGAVAGGDQRVGSVTRAFVLRSGISPTRIFQTHSLLLLLQASHTQHYNEFLKSQW